MELALPQRKNEDHKRYLSFQDYLKEADRKPTLSNPTLSNPTNFNTQNSLERSRKTN
jgi:hypothetical protein